MKKSEPSAPKLAPADWVVQAGAVDDVLARMDLLLQRRKRRRRRVVGAAGTAALTCLVLVFWVLPLWRHTAVLATSGAEQRTLVLEDGSCVELNARTRLHTDFRYGRRVVRLEQGEAFFAVAKDAAHPFRVETSAGTVRVTGTQFGVRLVTGACAEVTLCEGAVLATPARPSRADAALALAPGQQATLSDGEAFRRTLSAAQLEHALAWRTGRVEFDGDALGEAVRRFAAFHGVTITVAPAVASLRLGGSYQLAELGAFFDALEATLPVRVYRHDGVFAVGPR